LNKIILSTFLALAALANVVIFGQAQHKTKSNISGNGPIVSGAFSQPLAVSWFYPVDTTHFNQVADNDRVYVPSADGTVICLSATKGDLLWKSAPVADFTADPLLVNGELFIAAKKGTSPTDANAGILRAIDTKTGVTLRSTDFPRPLTSMIIQAGIIYAGSEDSKVYALRVDNGSTVWSFQTGASVHGRPLLRDGKIFIGSDDKNFYAVDAASGKEIWKIQTLGKVTGLATADSKRVYFGSSDGFVYGADIAKGKIDWRVRTGATVDAAPINFDRRVIVGSYDNFLYALREHSGDIIWKQRMGNRIVSSPLVDNGTALVAPLRSTKLSVLDLRDGTLLNETKLPEDAGEIVSAPSHQGQRIYISTDLGLLALSSNAKIGD